MDAINKNNNPDQYIVEVIKYCKYAMLPLQSLHVTQAKQKKDNNN